MQSSATQISGNTGELELGESLSSLHLLLALWQPPQDRLALQLPLCVTECPLQAAEQSTLRCAHFRVR